jgi:hypothetical protein
MDVSTTSRMCLTLALDQNQQLMAKFAGSKSSVNLTVDAILDGSGRLLFPRDRSAAGMICFTESVVYGWYGDPTGNDRRIVFWIERAASDGTKSE